MAAEQGCSPALSTDVAIVHPDDVVSTLHVLQGVGDLQQQTADFVIGIKAMLPMKHVAAASR
jgi:hypothetical protein